MTDLLTKWRALPLMWTEALRALVCLLPMIVATALGRTTYLVALGQGAFFVSSLFLPIRLGARFVMGSLIVALGLGFYLIGGAVAPYPWVAVIFTFFVCLNLSFLSGWLVSPEKASANFLVFAVVMSWSSLISLLPPALVECRGARARSHAAGRLALQRDGGAVRCLRCRRPCPCGSSENGARNQL